MNKLSTQDRVQILNALSEGVGINAASRITGKSKNTSHDRPGACTPPAEVDKTQG